MEEGLRKKFEESLDRRFKSYRSSFHIPARVAGESVTNVASERARMEERMERVIGLWSYRGTASERFPEILSTKFPELSAKSYSHVRTRSKRMSKSQIPGSKSQGNLIPKPCKEGRPRITRKVRMRIGNGGKCGRAECETPEEGCPRMTRMDAN